MSWSEYLILLAACALTIFICRVAPLLILKGRDIPEHVSTALGLIPPAAFAALVSNDVFAPGMFDMGLWPAGAILVAAVMVVIVALKTKSLIWSAIAGVASYALLLAL